MQADSETLKIKRTKITADYKITTDVLGSGVSGKVLSCVCTRTGVKRALKVLEDTPAARREAELHWRASACPNIVSVIDVYENGNQNTRKMYILIVMECMEGGELFDRVRATQSLTEQEAANIVFQIASAMFYLHSNNIAHRDLKPENLLFANKDMKSLKLVDFGFAREVLQTKSLKTPCYTPYYVAPEILNRVPYDKSCDLWSMGVIMYILLCGFPPFYSRNGQPISPGMQSNITCGQYDFPSAYWGHISSQAKDLIRRLLKINPESRISISEVMQHPWIAGWNQVPSTPLATGQLLDPHTRDNIQEVITSGLRTMRHDPENTLILGAIEASTNRLLLRRQRRNQCRGNVRI